MEFKDVKNVEGFAHMFSSIGARKVSPVEAYNLSKVPEELRTSFTVKPYNPIVAEEVKQLNKAGREKRLANLRSNGYEFGSLIEDIDAIQNMADAISEEDTKEQIEERNNTAKKLILQVKGRFNERNGLKELFGEYEKTLMIPIEAEGEKLADLQKELSQLKKSKKDETEVRALIRATETGIQNGLECFPFSYLTLIVNKFNSVAVEYENSAFMSRDLNRVLDIIIEHTDSVENLIVIDGEGNGKSYSGDFGKEQLYALTPDVLIWLEDRIGRESQLSDKELVGL